MIWDGETNFLYLSNLLKLKYKNFFNSFSELLIKNKIKYKIIPETNDIWVKDYMPIQISKQKFIQFTYNPDYLKRRKNLITDTFKIIKKLNLNVISSKIKLDGGNVVKSKNKIIMTNKIFKENKSHSKTKLKKELCKLFKVEKIIFIPQEPYDYLGHADGIVRFLDENTVLINDYTKVSPEYKKELLKILKNEKLDIIEIPLGSKWENYTAIGYYINYLHMKNFIVLPLFNLKEDEIVVKKMQNLFKGYKVICLNSIQIAKKNGVLNCIAWNIMI